jgi:hypothetical protein
VAFADWNSDAVWIDDLSGAKQQADRASDDCGGKETIRFETMMILAHRLQPAD